MAVLHQNSVCVYLFNDIKGKLQALALEHRGKALKENWKMLMAIPKGD